MDEALQILIEMNEWTWNRFKGALRDMTQEESDWRPLPQANNIKAIVRHLRIEAESHAVSLECGQAMPAQVTESVQKLLDSVPPDFDQNLKALEELYTRFVGGLGRTTLPALKDQTARAYRDFPGEHPTHLLGFHQAVHLAQHFGQICTIRNLYRKIRGEPARFFPNNPTFPEA